MPETQTFKIASWNAQQLTFDRVQETRQFVHDSDIDILCVQETGLRAENERKKNQKFSITGFSEIIRMDSSNKKIALDFNSIMRRYKLYG